MSKETIKSAFVGVAVFLLCDSIGLLHYLRQFFGVAEY